MKITAALSLCLFGLLAMPAIAAQGFSLGDCALSTQAGVDANTHTTDFSIPGHIHLACPTRTIDADRAKGNQKQKRTTLSGHVVIHELGGSSAFGGFSATGQTAQGPSTLTTDKLEVDGVRKFDTATGNVHYVSGNRNIDADKGTLDDVSKDLTLYTLHFTEGTQKVDAVRGVMNSASHNMDLTGNVHIVDGDRRMEADHVIYNTLNGDLHARGNVSMHFPGGEDQSVTTVPAKKKKKRLIPF